MRVVIVSESFLPTVNGVTGSVCRVLDYLAANGHEALVIVPSAGAPAEYAGFRVVQVPAILYRRFPVGLPAPSMQKIIDDFEPDVVHLASPFLLGAQAIASCNRLGIPTVAVFQTDMAGYARRNRLAAISGFAWRVMRWVHRGADLTLAPSSATLSDLERVGVERLRLWGRGVDLDRYHPRNRQTVGAQALHRRLAPRDEVVIGYVGRLAPEKQVERMTALRGVPGIRLAIVGDGPSRPLLGRALAGMPVSFLGELHGDDLTEAYASFDFFLHTGAEETFGQTIQEAHANGLAVVAPRSGGPIDLVSSGENGILYEPDDNASLRRAVERLAGDSALRMRMGEAGRRRVLGRSWTTICDELLDHYRAAITARAASGATEPTLLKSR